jgi:hypothetical protein
MFDKINRYNAIILEIFKPILESCILNDLLRIDGGFKFTRDDIRKAANTLKITLPDNLGDVVYTYRYRADLPPAILAIAPDGNMWIIEGDGKSKYRARIVDYVCLTPNESLRPIKIPDATPPNIRACAKKDEQYLLSTMRVNNLFGIFLGFGMFHVGSAKRSAVKKYGQIEIDDLYTGIDKNGVSYVIPIQAKRNSDRHSVVQTLQDVYYCKEEYPEHVCVPISVQFMKNETIAMFRLEEDSVKDSIKVVEELHYTLSTTWD